MVEVKVGRDPWPQVRVGEKLPDVELYEGQLDKEPVVHSLRELTAGKKVVLFTTPGAFTPTCSKTHLPSFRDHFNDLMAAGADRVICTTTNDPYVVAAWAEASDIKPNTIMMLSDKDAKLCKAMGLVGDGTGAQIKNMRYALIAEDGSITHFFPSVKENGEKCPENTFAPHVLEALKPK